MHFSRLPRSWWKQHNVCMAVAAVLHGTCAPSMAWHRSFNKTTTRICIEHTERHCAHRVEEGLRSWIGCLPRPLPPCVRFLSNAHVGHILQRPSAARRHPCRASRRKYGDSVRQTDHVTSWFQTGKLLHTSTLLAGLRPQKGRSSCQSLHL